MVEQMYKSNSSLTQEGKLVVGNESDLNNYLAYRAALNIDPSKHRQRKEIDFSYFQTLNLAKSVEIISNFKVLINGNKNQLHRNFFSEDTPKCIADADLHVLSATKFSGPRSAQLFSNFWRSLDLVSVHQSNATLTPKEKATKTNFAIEQASQYTNLAKTMSQRNPDVAKKISQGFNKFRGDVFGLVLTEVEKTNPELVKGVEMLINSTRASVEELEKLQVLRLENEGAINFTKPKVRSDVLNIETCFDVASSILDLQEALGLPIFDNQLPPQDVIKHLMREDSDQDHGLLRAG